MHLVRTTLLTILVAALAGCGVIPGDAALRLGQPEKAAEFYRRGAEHGDGDSALRLGMLIDKRQVSASVYGSAFSWFQKACELGNLAGCHNIGVAYEYGTNGLPKDYVQARVYYLKAASAGYMPSQYNLGSLYANNHVSPPDDVEGLKWIMLAQMSAAADTKHPLTQWVLQDLPGHKHRLEMRLSDAQIRDARRLADEWQSAHPKKK